MVGFVYFYRFSFVLRNANTCRRILTGGGSYLYVCFWPFFNNRFNEFRVSCSTYQPMTVLASPLCLSFYLKLHPVSVSGGGASHTSLGSRLCVSKHKIPLDEWPTLEVLQERANACWQTAPGAGLSPPVMFMVAFWDAKMGQGDVGTMITAQSLGCVSSTPAACTSRPTHLTGGIRRPPPPNIAGETGMCKMGSVIAFVGAGGLVAHERTCFIHG